MKKEITGTQSASIFVIGFFICQALVLVVNFFGIIFGSSLGYDTTSIELFFNTSIGYLICVAALNLGMIISFLYSKKRYSIKPFKKPQSKKCLIYIAIAAISFFALYPLITCFDNLFFSWGINTPEIPYNLTTANYFISIISLVVLPAVCEELFFRGVIFSGLKNNRKTLSIVITSLMFSIFHMSIYQSIYPFLFGLLLGGIMYKEDNIIYCIVAHATNNFISLTLSYFNVSLTFSHWTYILLSIILFAIWITLLVIFLVRIKSHEKLPFTRQDKIFTIVSLAIMLILWIIVLITG